MLGLSDGERISMIRSAVLTQYTCVTDRRTDGRTDRRNWRGITRYSIYAVARKKKLKTHVAVNSIRMTELRDVTCHMGSHRVTCYPTQVNAPRPNPSQ